MKDFLQKTFFGPRHRWWALSIVALAVFMTTTDTGLLTISLPVIIREFEADLALTGWIALVYALVAGSLYLPCGRLSDLVGRKKTMSAGFLVYAVSSAIAGFSQGPLQLIVFRALQAVGSATIMANTFALATSLFPPEERGRAMGLSGGMIAALGFIVGPILGGLITHTLGWRFIFYVTAALGIIGYLACRFILPGADAVPRTRREPYDFTGTAAFILGLTSFLLALTGGQRESWTPWQVQGGFLLSLSAFSFFVWWQARTPYPLLDLRLFFIRTFATGNSARLTSFAAISMNNLMMPFFLQLGLGLDPLRAGALMTPTAIAMALVSPVSGWLADRFGPRLLATGGLVIKAVAFLWLGRLTIEAGPFDIASRLVFLGLGMGIFHTPNNALLMNSIPPNRLGVASSFLSIMRSVGQSAGVALATTILSASLFAVTGTISLIELRPGTSLENQPLLLTAFLDGFGDIYMIAGILCILGAAVSSLSREGGNQKSFGFHGGEVQTR